MKRSLMHQLVVHARPIKQYSLKIATYINGISNIAIWEIFLRPRLQLSIYGWERVIRPIIQVCPMVKIFA